MSIASAIAAEYGEKKRKEWISKLEQAYLKSNWADIAALLDEMRLFYFSE